MSPALDDLPRLWRTLRPLRPEQLWGRLIHEARQVTFRQLPQLLRWRLQGPGALAPLALTVPPPARDPAVVTRARASHAQGRVWLAGREVAPTDWSQPALPKLVRYHLHYLDVARSWAPFAADDALALVLRWKDENPVGGSEGWEPYPVSARLLNLGALAASLGTATPAWLRAFLTLHARYVVAFPERHLQANHLLKNWIALACAGLLLQGPEAGAWADRGLEEVEGQLKEQILPDGGHYERSPMYHSLLLWDLLDLRDYARAAGRSLPWLNGALDAMAGFLASVLHPDGDIPLFNDAVLGQAPLPAEVFGRLNAMPIPVDRIATLPDTGLRVLRPSREEALVFDAGPLGPAHQPGHAHSDTLSFELSVGGERRAVNGGMDGYQSAHRAFYRSAVAHNTVTVNGEGPDELWGSFRVGGRSRVLEVQTFDRVDHLALRATLQAFQGWRHSRTLMFFPRRALVVFDQVETRDPGTVVSRLRLVPGQTPLRFVPLAGEAGERSTAYAPELGRVFEATEHSVQGRGSQVRLAYALLWGASQVAWRPGPPQELELDGQRYRPPEAPCASST